MTTAFKPPESVVFKDYTDDEIIDHLIDGNDYDDTVSECDITRRKLDQLIDENEIVQAHDTDGDLVFRHEMDTAYAEFDDLRITEDNEGWCQVTEQSYAKHLHDEITVYHHRNREQNSTKEIIQDNDDFCYIHFGNHEGDYIHYDIAICCIDIDDYVHRDDAYYCEVDEQYYYDPDEMPSNNDSEHVSDYHNSPDPEYILGAYNAKFRIGFEIEKSIEMDEGDPVENNGLFAGFELDSSCGTEGITHILPCNLNNTDVQRYINDEEFLNEDADLSCGGHLTVSSNQFDPCELSKTMLEKMGLIYSIWAPRLKNRYVAENNSVKKEVLKLEYVKNSHNHPTYSPVRVKRYGVEIRVPNAVSSSEQLWRRYQFMAAFLENMHRPWAQFIFYMREHTVALYNGNHKKASDRINRAYLFQAFIDTGEVDDSISEYIYEGDD